MALGKHRTGIELGATDRASSKVLGLGKSFDVLARKSKGLNATFAKMGAIKNQFSGFNKLGSSFQSFGRRASLGLTLPMALFGASTIRASVDFEQGMNKVKALTGETGEALLGMREKAKALGATTVFSASQAADAMGFLGMAGFNTSQIMGAIEPVLNLAASSGIELGRAADIASNIMGAFGIQAENASRVADVLAKVTAKSNVNMEQLADTMSYAAPIAAKFGVSIEDTAAAAGLLGNIGIQGTKAGTALKNAFLGLAAPTSMANKILKKLGVQVSDLNTGEIRPFAAIMGDMGEAIKDLPQAKQLAALDAVFGKIGLAGASELIKQAKTGKLKTFGESLQNIEGYATEMAATLNSGAPGSVKNFTSALEGAKIQIWEKGGLKDAFIAITDAGTAFLRSINNMNPFLLKVGVSVAFLTATLGPLALGIGTIIKLFPLLKIGFLFLGKYSMLGKVFGLAATAAKFLGTAVMFLGKAFLLNPIGLTITAIALGAILLIKYWTPVKTFFINMWDSIKAAFDFTFGYISEKFNKLKSFFGFGGETKVKVFGPEKSNQESGSPSQIYGKERGMKRSNEAIKTVSNTSTNNAAVSVDFSNLPTGSKVSSSKNDFLNLNLGYANL